MVRDLSPSVFFLGALLALVTAGCSKDDALGAADAGPPVSDGGDAGDGGAVESIAQTMGFTGMVSATNDESRNQKFLAAMGYASEAACLDDVVAQMGALYAPMARAHFYYVGNGQFVTEAIVGRLEAQDYDVYGWINPIPPQETPDAPFDGALAALVEAHPKIRTWQLGNEPDLGWEQKSLFPAFFVRAQPIIRAACPACRIMLAGISNQYDSGSQNFQTFEGFVDEISQAGLDGKPFDLFDFHYYQEAPSRSEISTAVADYRAMLARHGFEQIPVWCTETGLYSGDPGTPDFGPRTEDEQARDLPKLVVWMTAAGVQHIYWWTLINSFADGPALFNLMGLVYNGLGDEAAKDIHGGTKKKAYVTYGLIAEALQGVTGVSRVEAGVYRVDRDQGPAWVVWGEDGVASVTVHEIGAAKARVQDLVPDADGVAASTDVLAASGAVTLAVDALPKLVTPAK